ncbi:sulfatase-like hydrolase/transferase [candidate division WOR-3 bacterium]|nr:sulfatase-like hydrolase/transferase [candidate division WOR-3 bacterium]
MGSLYGYHHPYFPPKQFFEALSNQKFDILRGIKLIKKILYSEYNPTNKEKQFILDLYDASVRYVDHAINLLFKYLDENGIIDNTYVIITADHGEEFWDHGHYGHGAQIGRPMKLYNEMIHVPLIFFGPDVKNKKIEQPVSLTDLVPTILDMIDIEYSAHFDGENIMNTTQKERSIIAESISPGDPVGYMKSPNKYEVYAYIKDEWKYILYTTNKRRDELYNLKEDPKESTNVIYEYPEIAEELKRGILEHIQRKRELSSEKTKIADTVRKLKLKGKL